MVVHALSLSVKGLVLPIPSQSCFGFISVEVGGFAAEMMRFQTGVADNSGVLCILKDLIPNAGVIPMASLLKRAPITVSVLVQDFDGGGEMRTVAHGRLLESEIPVERTRDVDASALGLGGLRGVSATPLGQLEVAIELESRDVIQRGVLNLSIAGLELCPKDEDVLEVSEKVRNQVAGDPVTPDTKAAGGSRKARQKNGGEFGSVKSPVGVDEQGQMHTREQMGANDDSDGEVVEDDEEDEEDELERSVQELLDRVDLNGSVESLRESLHTLSRHTPTPPAPITPPVTQRLPPRRTHKKDFIFPAVGLGAEGDLRVQVARFSAVAPGAAPMQESIDEGAARTLLEIDRQRAALARAGGAGEQQGRSPRRLPVRSTHRQPATLHYSKQ